MSQRRNDVNVDIDREDRRTTEEEQKRDLLYSVEEVPPWYLCIVLGFQHYLTAFGSTISVPLILYKSFCIAEDKVGLGELINTIFFVSGLCTIIQTSIGIRLPIIQGGTFAFLIPTTSILSLPQWSCPYTEAEEGKRNLTDLPAYGSEGHREIWHARICEIQGAILVASLFQVVIGASGLMGAVLRFIGPLSITPTISLIGLALFPEAANLASKHWYIACMTIFLIALFSQYLRNISIPVCNYQKGEGCRTYKVPIFKLFPVLLAMVLSWVICFILTAAGAFPDSASDWGHGARSDIKLDVLTDAQWFRFPYPGQWGVPTVSVAGVFGMLAGVFASMIESIGDYFACARLAGAPPPPMHAVNRGIVVEGIGCIVAGAWGSGNGTTSYSENVGAIGITKVGSRRVVQVGGILMIMLGCLGKFGALFVTIPDPVIGGVFMVMFGMITAVGLSSLQFVDLNSSRNIFIIGFSLFFGISFPIVDVVTAIAVIVLDILKHFRILLKNYYLNITTLAMNVPHKELNKCSHIANQIISVLLSTSMFVGGVTGFILDNTIPGTLEERGISKWRHISESDNDDQKTHSNNMAIYDLPLIQKYLDRLPCLRYIPVCPSFDTSLCCRSCGCKKKQSDNMEKENQAYEPTGTENTAL